MLDFDVDSHLIEQLGKANTGGHGVARKELHAALENGFTSTTEFNRLADCGFITIAVGTPFTESNLPDLTQVEQAAHEITRQLRPNQLVVLESTSCPGTTEEVVLPILETSGYQAGTDFLLAYSPERIDLGSRKHRLQNIPKLVGGLDADSAEVAAELYRQVVNTTAMVSNARVAEAAKIMKNLFRSVNVALVNEIALILEQLGIDAWDAIAAAASKPFGYMPFFPGPSVGGHCIPLDPYYLSYRARMAGYMPRFVELSGELNEYMKYHTLELLHRALREAGKEPRGSQVAVLGIAFKRNVADKGESPAIRIIEECH